MDVDAQVQEAIRRSGKTYAQIARESGLSQPAVNRIANGTRSASLETLRKMTGSISEIADIAAAELRRAS